MAISENKETKFTEEELLVYPHVSQFQLSLVNEIYT